MHMADALLSPEVGGTMWAATAAITAYCARRVQDKLDNRTIPLMGVLGAFVFAAQMINFAIPGTGSSGHLGGGLLLAILLGPHAAFLTLASVLTVQALFFADGGLLALGSNIFNLGFFPCFVAYPLVYKVMVRGSSGPGRPARIIGGTVAAALIGLQLGSFGVVLQTWLSGITALPLASFLLVMQPIHLAIGLVEGLATAGVVSFIWKARPEILDLAMNNQPLGNLRLGKVFIGIAALALFTGGMLAWYASEQPDGLEWSLEKVTGATELETPDRGLHAKLDNFQSKTSILPDYGFKDGHASVDQASDNRAGTTLSGLLGGFVVLTCGVFLGFLLKKKSRQA